MRHCLALCGAAALFLSPVLGESLRGEQQQPPPPRPGVQVGVPEGRGGAPANRRAVDADAQPDLPPRLHRATLMVARSLDAR